MGHAEESEERAVRKTMLPTGELSLLPPANDAVRREWTRRIEAEYRSSAQTQHLTLWLIQLGAPRELIDDGLRIVHDELDHAELSVEVCAEAGADTPPAIRQADLEIRGGQGPLESRILEATIEVFCLGETVAVPLFRELRRHTIVPVARRALDRILVDEVRHKQFGWDLLDYLCDRFPALIDVGRQFLPGAIDRLEKRYGRFTENSLDEVERAWGLMAPRTYKEILEQTIAKEYRPRFGERGLL